MAPLECCRSWQYNWHLLLLR